MDLYKTIIYIKSQKIEEFSETFLIRPQGGGDTLFTGRRGHPVYREEGTPCIQGGGDALYTGRRGGWRVCILGHPVYREEGRMENMFIGTPYIQGGGENGEYVYWDTLYLLEGRM